MGYLLSAFLWAYAFSQLPTGAMVDKLWPRLLLTCGLALWSLAQFLGGLVQSFGQFFAARLLLGVGEAPQFPTGARVVRDWFHPRDRGLATGIFNCASSLGTAIAVPLLTFLMLSFGWRVMFMIMGVAGLAMAALWYVFYRNPNDVDLTAEETAYRTQGDPPGQRTVVTLREWKQLFRFRTTWGMILGYFGCIYLTWIYTAWLPGYLELERHMSVKFTGFAAAIPFVWGVVGGLLGGYLADILVRRGLSPVNSRRYPATIALCGTAFCTVAAAFVTSNALAIAFISASLFLLYVTSTCAWALSSVAAPTNCTASIGAMQNFGGYLGGALAPTVTGLIVQHTGSFIPASGRRRGDWPRFGGVVLLHRRSADHRRRSRRRLARGGRAFARARRLRSALRVKPRASAPCAASLRRSARGRARSKYADGPRRQGRKRHQAPRRPLLRR